MRTMDGPEILIWLLLAFCGGVFGAAAVYAQHHAGFHNGRDICKPLAGPTPTFATGGNMNGLVTLGCVVVLAPLFLTLLRMIPSANELNKVIVIKE